MKMDDPSTRPPALSHPVWGLFDLSARKERARPAFEAGLLDGDYWRTPRAYTDPCEAVAMVPLFDPCPADATVDGLAKSTRWGRSCFVNPPYSRGQLMKWVEKGLEELTTGKMEECFWLINYGNTKNRKAIKKYAVVIVDLYQRVSFINPVTGMPKKGNDRDSVIYYWSSYVLSDEQKTAFKEAFGEIGKVGFFE